MNANVAGALSKADPKLTFKGKDKLPNRDRKSYRLNRTNLLITSEILEPLPSYADYEDLAGADVIKLVVSVSFLYSRFWVRIQRCLITWHIQPKSGTFWYSYIHAMKFSFFTVIMADNYALNVYLSRRSEALMLTIMETLWNSIYYQMWSALTMWSKEVFIEAILLVFLEKLYQSGQNRYICLDTFLSWLHQAHPAEIPIYVYEINTVARGLD